MPFARSHDASIYWKLEGERGKPPLLLLHSIGCDMDLWDAALPALRRRFLLLRIDSRGHGASDAPHGDYDLAMLARDVAAAMTHAGIDAAAIAGVSLGGMIAMQLALDSPERVTALALVCTSATMDRAAWQMRVDAVRTDGIAAIADLAMSRFVSPAFAKARPEIVEMVREGLLTMSPDGYAGCAAAIRDMVIAGRLGDLTCPTLVVTGDRDTSTPLLGHGDYLVAGIADARHVRLDAAHLAPLDAPELLANALIGFLQ